MKYKVIKKQEDRYYLNEYQFFYVDKNEMKARMSEIQFPAIVMDTEFFNRSHESYDYNEKNFPRLYDEEQKDLVYVLQYSFAQNFKEIHNRQNSKAIKSMTIKRNFKDPEYSFESQYDSTVKSFINMCINKNIKTLVFAGKENDARILKAWINKNKVLLNNKRSDLFIMNHKTKEYDVNAFDIYNVLNQNMSFSNFDKNGKQFYEPKNLKPGKKGENTLALPSLKKFFDYMQAIYPNTQFEEEDDIYNLCVSALRFFSYKDANFKDYLKLNKDVKKAKTHCYNDVLKLLYLIDFLYVFMFYDDAENKYIKK